MYRGVPLGHATYLFTYVKPSPFHNQDAIAEITAWKEVEDECLRDAHHFVHSNVSFDHNFVAFDESLFGIDNFRKFNERRKTPIVAVVIETILELKQN